MPTVKVIRAGTQIEIDVTELEQFTRRGYVIVDTTPPPAVVEPEPKADVEKPKRKKKAENK